MLLNFHLILTNSSVEQSTFDEVQKAYDLTSLKLIKPVVARWLSQVHAAQGVLDRSEALVSALDKIYLQKRESTVRGVTDDLAKSKTTLSFCFFSRPIDSYKCATNSAGRGMYFFQVPEPVNKLILLLESKQQNSSQPAKSNFQNVECFFVSFTWRKVPRTFI